MSQGRAMIWAQVEGGAHLLHEWESVGCLGETRGLQSPALKGMAHVMCTDFCAAWGREASPCAALRVHTGREAFWACAHPALAAMLLSAPSITAFRAPSITAHKLASPRVQTLLSLGRAQTDARGTHFRACLCMLPCHNSRLAVVLLHLEHCRTWQSLALFRTGARQVATCTPGHLLYPHSCTAMLPKFMQPCNSQH